MNKENLKGIIYTGLFLVPFVPFLVYGGFFFPFITTKAFVFRFIVEIVFFAWIILALAYPVYRPRRSPILYAVLGFLSVITLADLLGVEPWKSFWSNFERMEGLVALLHLGAYFTVLCSVFDTEDWRRWWRTTLFASFLMVIYCSFQLAGVLTINQGGARVDGTLGNASYLAVYMLMHIFITLFFWLKAKNEARWVYAILIVLQVWILYSTATRGAILGLLGGLLIVAVLNLRSKERLIRRTSIYILSALLVVIAGFFMLRDTAFVKNSPVLSRFASISTEELKSGGRSFVWPMAIEGIKERPLLGWGQENFNYVFNEHYSPRMYNLEPWFDRAHNIFLDWGIAGGLLGLLAYLSLYVTSLYLLKLSRFTYEEKTVITGFIAAYFFHNFFVFDQLVSYVFFFAILAYIHYHGLSDSKAPELKSRLPSWSIGKTLIPVTVLFLLVIYFVNINPLRANIALIEALKNIGGGDAAKSIAAQSLERAYRLSGLGRSETVEQISQHTLSILTSSLPVEEKNTYYNFAKNAVVGQTFDRENDARYEIVAGTFLGQTGSLEEAAQHFEKAISLIPGKQLVYFEYGNVLLNKGDRAGALTAFKQAYDLSPDYPEAQIIYLLGAIYAHDRKLEATLISEIGESRFYFEDRIIAAYYASGRKGDIVSIINERLKRDPANAAVYQEYLKQLN